MGRSPFVRSWSAPLLVRGAEARRVDVRAVLRELGLPEDASSLPLLDVDLATLRRLGDALAHAAGGEALGLTVGATLPRGAYGLLELCVRASLTVRDAFTRLARLGALVNPLAEMRLHEGRATTTFTERVPGEPLGVGAEVGALTAAIYVRVAREALADPAWAPVSVALPGPAPALHGGAQAAYRDFFDPARLAFGGGAVALVLRARDLERPLASADPVLAGALEAELERTLAARPPPSDLPTLLRERLRAQIEAGDAPELAPAARALGLSVRTAQRRLLEAGAPWARLVDDVRRDLALARVERGEGDGDLKGLARRLGYADARAFARAFRRWTGTSPAAFRAARRG